MVYIRPRTQCPVQSHSLPGWDRRDSLRREQETSPGGGRWLIFILIAKSTGFS